jgi:uncharacterized radical SAM superfamily Fe-S cluster-containing enzyme
MYSHKKAIHKKHTNNLLEETKSLCPVCMQIIPANIYTNESIVFMDKTCPIHGSFQGIVWSDYQLYQRSFRFNRKPTKPKKLQTSVVDGCPYDCGLCPEHKQHTCLAIIDVTDRCNLSCPVCLSSCSKNVSDPNIADIESGLKKLFESEGKSVCIQLSGGEPTVRKDLVDIVTMVSELGFTSIEIDTNGIELAKNPKLAKELVDAGLSGVYLQFDGLKTETYDVIRGFGSNLLSLKNKAIKLARKADLEVALAATIVKGINDDQLWDIIKYAIKMDTKGVNFQPFAMLGRFPQKFSNLINKITIPDVVKNIEIQSGGELKSEDFVPIPCPDNRCAVLIYAVIKKGKITPINRIFGIEKIIDYYAEPADFNELVKAANKLLFGSNKDCPQCCSASMNLLQGQYFSIGCHGLQDIWNLDINRAKNCCVHRLTLDGRLVPFCLSKITSQNGEGLY